MPLGSVSFLDRGGNAILQGILGGQNMSLTAALSGAVQLTRDATSNQLAQETAFLGERRFDRSFRESQFVDRRNFDRNVFSQDRAFGEGVRQFDVNDRARSQDLALRSELGRGQLAVAQGGLALDQQKTDLYIKQGEQQLQRGDLVFEQAQNNQNELNALRERERILSDPEAFARANPDLSPAQLAERRAQGLGEVERGYTFLGRGESAKLVGDVIPTIGVLPSRTPADDAAVPLFIESEKLANDGDLIGSLEALAKAQATATEGSPQYAEILQRRNIVAAKLATDTGESDSLLSAKAATTLFEENKSAVFSSSTTVDKEIAKARAALTAEDYARDESDLDRTSAKKLTAAQRDTRAKKRLEFYYNVERSSDIDIDRARSKGDTYGRFLQDLLGK